MDIEHTVLRVRTEHEEQRELVMWFRQTYPQVRIFAIPNGGYRGKAQGMRLKVEGVSPGVPDLFVPAYALWIEMKKVSGGVLSPEQKDWIQYLKTINHSVIVGKGYQDAKEQIITFFRENPSA